jgi:hypothetical protein
VWDCIETGPHRIPTKRIYSHTRDKVLMGPYLFWRPI